MLMSSSEKFLWVCELNKDQPNKKWVAGDNMEFENADDKDYVVNSLVLKSAVLGGKAVDGERNLVSIKTKSYQEKEIEQPIFSLTLGRNDMVSLDLNIVSDNSPDVEFKLIQGTGPVFITCVHMIELPSEEDQSQLENGCDSEEEVDEEVEEEVEEEEEEKAKVKRGPVKNGKNGKVATNGKAENGAKKEDIELEEKPNKRKRN